MKRATALTVKLVLPSRARRRRIPARPVPPRDREITIFLEWLVASNLPPQLPPSR